MSHLAPRLIGGTMLAALALTACTPPYGDRDRDPAPTPEESVSPSEDPSPAGTPESAGGEVGLGETTRGVPDGVDEGTAGESSVAGVGWSSDGATLYVTTFGSSSCPLVPTDLTAGGGTITIEVTMTGGAVCTMDFVPSTTAIDAPEGIPTTEAHTVTIDDVGSTELPAAADPIAYAWIAAPTDG